MITGSVGSRVAHPLEHLEPVLPRQHHVEDHQVDVPGERAVLGASTPSRAHSTA